ncbi:MAG: hypothetical protein ACPGVD_08045 [Flavobacteriales bacterium]
MNWINRAWNKSMKLANSTKMQRQFAFLLLAFLLGLISYALVVGDFDKVYLVTGGVLILLVILIGLFRLKWMLFPLVIWLILGQILGEITSTIVLAFIYYLIFFPITFLIRIFKKNDEKVGWQEINSMNSDYRKLY